MLVIMRPFFTLFLNEWDEYLATLTIHLYKNDHNPTEVDEETDYEEADFPGYVEIALSAWDPAFINTENRGEKNHPVVTFTRGIGAGNNTIYGYYITDDVGYIVWAERNPSAPVLMAYEGQTYSIKPRITFRNDICA